MAKDRVAFGKHHVLARLGRGGMGDVYLAVNFGPAGVHKLIVIKQLRADLADARDARSMFLDEARIAARLNHPNVVQTYEVVEDGDELYLLMDFLDGQSLARILGRRHRPHFSGSRQLRILADALAGLHYAHELTDYDGTPLNVVHRDVSPQNIIVTYDGHVKLVDFGVAKAALTSTVTNIGTFKGKVRYCAPEQALCRDTDRRVDVFSMGVILWEMLAQRRMWTDHSDNAILVAIASGYVPSVSEIPAEVPAPLRAICAKALEPDAGARYQTALDFRNALLEYMRVTNEDTELGAVMTESFAEARRDLHGIIDAQIKAVREASVRALDVRSVPTISVDSVGLGLERSTDARRSSIPVAREITLPPPAGNSAGNRGAGNRSAFWIGAGITLAFAGIGGAAFLRPGMGQAAAGTSAPQATMAAPATEQVHLHLRATPPTAQFVLDGVPLVGNPYDGDVPRDVSHDPPTHTLVVKADGFEARTVKAQFTRVVDVDLTLVPALPTAPAHKGATDPRARMQAAKAGQAAGPGELQRASALTAPPKALRAIDEESPYGDE